MIAAVLFPIFALLLDTALSFPGVRRLFCSWREPKVLDEPHEDDQDILNEKARIIGHGRDSSDMVEARGLRKVFRMRTTGQCRLCCNKCCNCCGSSSKNKAVVTAASSAVTRASRTVAAAFAVTFARFRLSRSAWLYE